MTALYRIRPVSDRAQFGGKARPSPFAATWTTTRQDLRRELTAIRATAVVLELDVDESAILAHGEGLKAGRKVHGPGVRLLAQTKHGALVLATDEFGGPGDIGWHANVRAIARTLEALRMVDRYGVQRGAQYAGYRAITSGNGTPPAMTAEEAATVLVAASGVPDIDLAEVLINTELRRQLYRKAAARLHPDTGGDVGRWLRLTTARELLDAP